DVHGVQRGDIAVRKLGPCHLRNGRLHRRQGKVLGQRNAHFACTIGRVGIVYDYAKVNPPITAWGDLWRDDMKSSVSLPGITTTAGPLVV
ncbi:hypothetical protein ACC764_38375, partial [Rhizobium ruizarguesonis]